MSIKIKSSGKVISWISFVNANECFFEGGAKSNQLRDFLNALNSNGVAHINCGHGVTELFEVVK